ncbi:MAG: tyrosine-protein phosphatase [Anaerolineales bacterium]|nr:tyrosine-protein phosphatase [Anaerolineales bacterium]
MAVVSGRSRLARRALHALARATIALDRLSPRPRRIYPTADELLLLPEPDAIEKRFVPLEGGVNLRDIGGYPTYDGRHVRWGRVYRSGTLSDLTDADLERLAALNLRLICDLRAAEEIERQPDRLPPTPGLVYVHLPTNAPTPLREWLHTLIFRRDALDEVVADSYIRLATTRAEALGAVLTRLAAPDALPALIHCTAGKDRTGIIIALLLHLLGVADDLILADYALSNAHYQRILRAARHDLKRTTSLGLTENEVRPAMTVNAAYLQRLFAHLRTEYGSIDRYLRNAAGLTEETLERLRTQLLE